MNFKDEYKKDYDSIKLDDDFKKSLATKMNTKPRSNKIVRMCATFTVAAAAAAVAITLGLKGGKDMQDGNIGNKEDETMGVLVEQETSSSLPHGSISIDMWYGDAKTDVEIFDAFCQLLESNTLETLYCSEEETFGSEDILKEDDIKEVVDKLLNAEITDEEFKGQAKNYMAVFEDGAIIKFTISDEGYIKLKDMEKNLVFA